MGTFIGNSALALGMVLLMIIAGPYHTMNRITLRASLRKCIN